MTTNPLPYGINDLDPRVQTHSDDPNLIRCFVRGCDNFVHRVTRDGRGQACPQHGIFCHYSRGGLPTYSYEDPARNIIASPDLFTERVVGNPDKYESDRLGNERSEDALTWNVFRSLCESNALPELASLLLGIEDKETPCLYLWGLRVDDDTFAPWGLLSAARKRFEAGIPADRPRTEPDVAIHLPGKYLLLIEAKFTSPNKACTARKQKKLLTIYNDEALRVVDSEKAKEVEPFHEQLWRNIVFADWMAHRDNLETKPYVVNLVREAAINEAAAFTGCLRDGFDDRFRIVSWEAISEWITERAVDGSRVGRYLKEKSSNLQNAFDL